MTAVHEGRDERGRATVLPPALAATKWQPGFAPNPTGKSGDYQRCRSYCREIALENAQGLYKLANETNDERVEYMCRTWLYEQAYGKAKDYDPRDEAPPLAQFDPSQLSPERLEQVKQAMLLIMQTMRAPVDMSVDHGNKAESVSDNKEVSGK